MSESQLQVAAGYMADAHKHTKPGWFRKPEWDIAAQYYEKAANAYKAARSTTNAIEAYQKSAEANTKFTSLFLAGKSLESAATLAQQAGDNTLAAELYIKASDLFMAHGASPDKSADMVEKAALQCEPIDLERTLELYTQCCAIFESEERERLGIDTIKRAVACAVRHNQYPKALFFLDKLAKASQVLTRKSEIDKAKLSSVVVLLAMDDVVEARKRLDQWLFADPSDARLGSLAPMATGAGSQWGPSGSAAAPEPRAMSPEAQVGQAMVSAFEQWDGERLREILNDQRHAQTIHFLPAEVAKLTRTYRIPGKPMAQSSGPVAPTSTTTATSPQPGHRTGTNAPEEEEDDDGLC
ncbi:hypothetical protein H4R34_003398 [Dimargaris verticillata]|uniref:Gamma-soluble NSF attachment protein n=1 Tax=Dimargaris verticillata TaxID=2761393 RepID=A0A9W8B4M6_9FUNG|nr:hypothetical protein H4R34_003398 [Dimargaris verticillata]